MELFSVILLILFLCRVFAEIAERFNQPALIGELVAGILLGLFIKVFGSNLGLGLDFINEDSFHIITDLGIFFLMLLAGLELHPQQMKESSKPAFVVAAGGLILPLILGVLLGHTMLPDSEHKLGQMLFLGTALAITAVPVAVRVLMDLNQLDTSIGRTIVSAAVIDDILSLMLLALLTGIIKTGSIPSFETILILSFKVVAFLSLCFLLGKYAFPHFMTLLKKGEVQEGDFGGLLLMGFSFAILAELFSLHFIIGAFFAGLMFQKSHAGKKIYEKVERRVHGVTSGFLAPIFFASIGLHLSLGALFETPVFTVALLFVAVFGKVIGAGLPALFVLGDKKEALTIGFAMNGRGAVELIIIDIALRAGLFNYPAPTPPIIENMYSSIVIMAIATTMITPICLRHLIKG